MINQKIENIDELKQEEQIEISDLSDTLINVSFKQVVFSDDFNDLLWTFLMLNDETLAGVSGNLQSS